MEITRLTWEEDPKLGKAKCEMYRLIYVRGSGPPLNTSRYEMYGTAVQLTIQGIRAQGGSSRSLEQA